MPLRTIHTLIINLRYSSRTIDGDHDVILPHTLHVVQDLPNQEKR